MVAPKSLTSQVGHDATLPKALMDKLFKDCICSEVQKRSLASVEYEPLQINTNNQLKGDQ